MQTGEIYSEENIQGSEGKLVVLMKAKETICWIQKLGHIIQMKCTHIGIMAYGQGQIKH